MTAPKKYLRLLALLLLPIAGLAQTEQRGLITLDADGRVVKFASGMQMQPAAPLKARDGHERYISKDLNILFMQINEHFACADLLNVNGNRSWIIRKSRNLGISSNDVPLYTVTTECFNLEGAEIDYSGYDAGVNGWYTPGGEPTFAEPFRMLGAYRATSPDRDLEAYHYVLALFKAKADETQARQAKVKAQQATEESDIDAGHIYKMGEGITPPVLIHSVDSEFSPEARRLRIEGVAVFSLVVTTRGMPERINLVRGLGHGLDEQALLAIKQYRFKPSTKDGVPVPVEITIESNFHIIK
jgi:TonB family protein